MPALTPEQLYRAACIHEIGHAVAAIALDIEVEYVRARVKRGLFGPDPDGEMKEVPGLIRLLDPNDPEELAELEAGHPWSYIRDDGQYVYDPRADDRLIVSFCGGEAERHLYAAWGFPRGRANRLARSHMVGDRALIREEAPRCSITPAQAERAAAGLVAETYPLIEAGADVLQEAGGFLPGDELLRVVA